MSFQDEYARYYDLFYCDKDYAGEADYVHKIIEKHTSTATSILELGCGTGTHASLLAQEGCTVHGVDRSEPMLEKAEARRGQLPSDVAHRLRFSRGDIRDFRIDEKYDAVISLFHVVSYLQTNDDLKAVFSTAGSHLKPGGIFVFDCWYGPTVLAEPPEIRVKRLENDDVVITRLSEPELLPNTNSVVVNYTVFIEDKKTGGIRKATETHRMRYLFTTEVEQFFESSGMKMLEAREWMTDRTPGTDTFGVYFVGRLEEE